MQQRTYIMPDPFSFMVAEWTLSGMLGGLFRVLSEVHRLVVLAPKEREANRALAAELEKLMLLCGSKVDEIRRRAVYRAPGAVDALSASALFTDSQTVQCSYLQLLLRLLCLALNNLLHGLQASWRAR